MLPNHAALVVAEQFGMLEALHPGPHRPRARARARHRSGHRGRAAAQPGMRSRPTSSPSSSATCSCSSTARIRRSPRCRVAGTGPRCGCSARATSARRSPARSACRSRSRITSRRTTRSPRSSSTGSRSGRRPSSHEPYAMIGVPVICAETDERARWLSGPSALSFVRLRQGRPTPLPDARGSRGEYVFTPTEREIVRSWTAPLIRGEPDRVRTRARSARGAHRRRRADDHDDGPRPRRPAAVLRAARAKRGTPQPSRRPPEGLTRLPSGGPFGVRSHDVSWAPGSGRLR